MEEYFLWNTLTWYRVELYSEEKFYISDWFCLRALITVRDKIDGSLFFNPLALINIKDACQINTDITGTTCVYFLMQFMSCVGEKKNIISLHSLTCCTAIRSETANDKSLGEGLGRVEHDVKRPVASTTTHQVTTVSGVYHQDSTLVRDFLVAFLATFFTRRCLWQGNFGPAALSSHLQDIYLIVSRGFLWWACVAIMLLGWYIVQL